MGALAAGAAQRSTAPWEEAPGGPQGSQGCGEAGAAREAWGAGVQAAAPTVPRRGPVG